MKTIIFDFDGTLVDSLPLAINLFNKLSVGNRELTKTDIKQLRELTARQVVKAVGIPIWKIPKLLALGRSEAGKHMQELELFSGIKEVIVKLDADYSLYVMSSNSTHNVSRFLKAHNIERYFEKVYGNVGIFGKSTVLKHIMKANELEKRQTLYIGDEVRDVEGAKKAGITSVAVTWGYNGAKILSSYKPDYLVDTPKDLLTIFKKTL